MDEELFGRCLVYGTILVTGACLFYACGKKTDQEKHLEALQKIALEKCEENHVYVVPNVDEEEAIYVVSANGQLYFMEEKQIINRMDTLDGVQLEADLNGDGKADFLMIVDDEFTKVDSNTLENLENSYTRKRD